MSGPFYGVFENAVHNKRVIIPALFKRKFSDESLHTVVVTAGPDGTIAIYPLDNWNEKLAKLENGTEDQRLFRTWLIDCTVIETELEGPGRVRVPEKQLLKSGITDSVVIKGEGNYISLWNPASYDAKYETEREVSGKKYSTHSFQ